MTRTKRKSARLRRRVGLGRACDSPKRMTAVARTMIRPQAFFCVNTPCQSEAWPAEWSRPMEGARTTMAMVASARTIMATRRIASWRAGE